MLKCGLTSISFRSHSRSEIVAAARSAGLGVMEWGSDVHLCQNDSEAISEILALSDAHGIETPTYGTYYRICETPIEDMAPLMDTAETIGAKTLRIWGGRGFVTPSDTEKWARLVSEARQLAEMAERRGLTLALECHIGTVSEDAENALRFITDVGSRALRSYWQPNQRLTKEANLTAIKLLAPYVDCIHAFNWSGTEKYPLREAKGVWIEYLKAIECETKKRDIPILLEFMPDGKMESLSAEAKALIEIVAEAKTQE